MPLMVPGVEESSIGAQPFGAPGVTPVRSAAPEQIEQSGAALQQAGGVGLRTGQTVGDAVQEQADGIAVKKAVNASLNSTQSILYDQDDGYYNKRGQAAVDAFQPSTEAITKTWQDGMGSLDNDIQKQAYRQVMTDHLLSNGKQMAIYNHGQSAALASGEAKALADNYQLLALNAAGSRYQVDADGNVAGDYAKNVFLMDTEVLKSAHQAGFDPDSAQAQSMVREQRTKLNQAIISKLLDNHDAYGAKAWLDEQINAGNMEVSDIERLGSNVKTEYDRQRVSDTAQELMTSALANSTSGGPAYDAGPFKGKGVPGLLKQGNVDVNHRPDVNNDDGSKSTIFSMTVPVNEDGSVWSGVYEKAPAYALVPSIVDGKFLTPDGKKPKDGDKEALQALEDKATDHYADTRQHLGIFSSSAAADKYAGATHDYGNDGTDRKVFTPSGKTSEGLGSSVPTTLTMPVPGSSINVTSQMGDARPGGRVHDGIDIAVPVGTNVLAPADGKVTKVWNDDQFGGGLSMEMQLPNGMTAGFAHLSATNVRVGDQVQQGGQLGLSGKTGNATGPVLHYMMKDADGNYVDPRQVSQAQPNKSGFADPNALDTALKALDARDDLDSYQKKQVATQLESIHSHMRSIQTQEYDDNMQTATNAFYASGGDYNAIPAAVRLQLRPEDTYKFQQGIPTKDNVDAQQAFILNPANQTVQWVQQHRMDFSNGTYLGYLAKAANDDNSPDKERNAALDNTQMDDILSRNGMWNLAQPTSDADKQAAVALKSRIMDQFVSQQNASKQPLTRDEKAQIIRQTVSDQVMVHHTIFSDSTNVPVVGLTDSQARNAYAMVGTQKVKLAAIPQADQLQITAALRRTGQPVTQQKIAEYWVAGRTKQNKAVPTF